MRTLLLVLACSVSLDAQRCLVKLDPQATRIHFTLGDVLHTVHGTFQLSKGEFWFDPASRKAGGLLIVNAASGESGSHARDSRMNKSILETQLFPEATFAPERIVGSVSSSGQSAFHLRGQFSIHGVSHELTMRVRSDIAESQLKATADFDVPYVAWGMKNPSTLFLRVDDTVMVEIQAAGQVTEQNAQ